MGGGRRHNNRQQNRYMHRQQWQYLIVAVGYYTRKAVDLEVIHTGAPVGMIVFMHFLGIFISASNWNGHHYTVF